MRFNLKNIFILFTILLSATVFASGPSDPPSPPHGTEPPPLSADQYICVLLGMAILFAFYSLKKKLYTK